MENELRKCPFCGGKAIFKTSSNSSSNHEVGFEFKIECKECGVSLPKLYRMKFCLTEDGVINPFYDDREQAVEDWNKRI